MIRLLLSVVMLAFLSLLALPVSAAVVFQDSFDGEAASGVSIFNYGGTGPGAFANWDVTAGDVDLIATGNFGIACASLKCLDLDGTSGSAGRIESKTTFGAGAYTLSFAISGNQRDVARGPDSVTVSLGTFSESFTLDAFDPFQTIVRTVIVGLAGSKIVFDHQGSDGSGNDQLGVILDNILLSDAVSIAEPGGMMLAMLIAGGLIRRRG